MNASKSVSLAADTTHTIVVLDDPGRLAIDPLTDAAAAPDARGRSRHRVRRHGGAAGFVAAAVGGGHRVRRLVAAAGTRGLRPAAAHGEPAGRTRADTLT